MEKMEWGLDTKMGGSCRTLNFISVGSPSTHIPAGWQLTKKKRGRNRDASAHCLQKSPLWWSIRCWGGGLGIWRSSKQTRRWSLVSAHCDGFHVKAHPFHCFSSKWAGPIGVFFLVIFGFENFLEYFNWASSRFSVSEPVFISFPVFLFLFFLFCF
jgi:hypothetical protein